MRVLLDFKTVFLSHYFTIFLFFACVFLIMASKEKFDETDDNMENISMITNELTTTRNEIEEENSPFIALDRLEVC